VTGGRLPKRKGDIFERAVAGYLRCPGFPRAERGYGAGRPDDRGDIDGVPGFVIEVKAHLVALRLSDFAALMGQDDPEADPW
jgi:hypothetical protein